MNVTDVNVAHQNCTNRIIHNMGEVISKENINESKYMKIPDNNIKLPDSGNSDKKQGNPIMDKIKSAIDLFESDESTRDADIAISEKICESLCKIKINENASKKNDQSMSKCHNKGDRVDFEQYRIHLGFMTELQSIVQGLYEAKLNDLKVLLCTCCSNSEFSPFEKPDDLYLNDAMESDNNSDECSNCDTCEAALKETKSKSHCGCADPSGFPHHISRKLRNPRCIDARVIYLVERLYEKNPHNLFQQLEAQVHNIVTDLHNHLETFMKNHINDTKHSLLFIDLILECYQNLCSAAKRVAPILEQLEKGHLSKFSLTWELLNRSIYLECIHMKMQPHVLEFVSQCRKMQIGGKQYRDDLVQRYIKLDGELILIFPMWFNVNSMIEDYSNNQVASQDRQKKIDKHCQALLDLENEHKKLKLHKIKRSNSEPVDEQPQQNNLVITMDTPANNKNSDIFTGSLNKGCTYNDNCQCFAPEFCISEEVIRVLNKETDGAVDGTNIKASSTPRGDIVCLPGDGKKISTRQGMENKSLLSKDASKVLSNLKLDNSGNLQTTDPKKQYIKLPEDFPCPCKSDASDCKHHNTKSSQKIPIHSPTCKSGLNSLTNGGNSVLSAAASINTDQSTSCPKHGKRKLHSPDWDGKSSSISTGGNKPEASDGSKPHSHGHNCKKSCGSEGESHVHWTPNTHNKGCACCYCSVYDGAPPNTCSPVNRKYNEARERLRGKLNKTKALNKASRSITDSSLNLDSKDPSRESSCPASSEFRGIEQLLEWIEGAPNKQQRDPVKKAEKKARQKLKRLADKEKEDEMFVHKLNPEPNKMYVVPEPSKPTATNCSDGMVNIRLLTSDVPRVAVTAVGSSPDKNKLLYTLINGQKIIPESEVTKKKTKKGKQDARVSVANAEILLSKETKPNVKQKKNVQNKQLGTDNIINKKTDDKLDKHNIKQDVKLSVKNNKDNKKECDKMKNSCNSKQKLLKVDAGNIPKCQDKFCQTDDKLSYANEILINTNKSKDNDKKSIKKEKNKQKDKQVITTMESLFSIDKKNEKKNKNKSAINQKPAKSKFNDSFMKTINKSDSDLNSSQEWIEINSKSRSAHNTKTNTVVNESSKKSNKSKKNKSKQNQEVIVNKTLTKPFENLNISQDTSVEITKDALKSSTLTKRKVSVGKYNEYSIMDQLNQGVGVERLKLPPGITLTKVDAATAFANQQRKAQQVASKNIIQSNIPKIQEYAMIIANPVQNDTDDSAKSEMPCPKPNSKSSRKSRRKNKNRSRATDKTQTEDGQTKMITLRNPLFQNSMLKLKSDSPEQFNSIQSESSYNPMPMPKQASITQNKDGMFTIRSPALQHAISTGASNFKPHPFAEISSDNNDHFSYFSNATDQNQHIPNENINLSQTPKFNLSDVPSSTPNSLGFEANVQDSDCIGNSSDQANFRNYSSFGNIPKTNVDFSCAGEENFSYFSTTKNLQQESDNNTQVNDQQFSSNSISDNMSRQQFSPSCSNNYPNQNVQRLNSQVTIHNISDSAYNLPSQGFIDTEASVEITKMPTIQHAYGKFGNIGEELTLTRSHSANVSKDVQSCQYFKYGCYVNGQTNLKGRKDSELVDNIFAPNQTVNLSELESEERDIESFKRFNYYFEPPKNKPKINLNVNDIVVKKKPPNATEIGVSSCNNYGEYDSNVQKYQINNCSQKKY